MAKTKEIRDITASIGPYGTTNRYWSGKDVVDKPPYPMYSFERPAVILWQAVYKGLIENGHTHKQAIEWLQSSNARYALDGSLGDALSKLGAAYAKNIKPGDI